MSAVSTGISDTTPPPLTNGHASTDSPANALPVAAAPPVQVDTETAKRMKIINDLGEDIAKQRRKLEKRETAAKEADAARTAARKEATSAANTLREMLDELAMLASGKPTGKLPYAEVEAAKASSTPKLIPADPGEYEKGERR